MNKEGEMKQGIRERRRSERGEKILKERKRGIEGKLEKKRKKSEGRTLERELECKMNEEVLLIWLVCGII